MHILYMLLLLHVNHFFCDLNLYVGIKFCKHFYLQVFNFAIFFTIAKIAKLKTREIKYQ